MVIEETLTNPEVTCFYVKRDLLNVKAYGNRIELYEAV